MSAICSAINSKRFHQAKMLIEMGINVNSREEKTRRTPLIVLCFLEEECKAAKICKLLLNHDAKVGLRDREGMNALHYACKYGREQLVSLMMDETLTFNPNSTDKIGNTALHYAALSGNFVVLNLLIKTIKRFKLNIDKENLRGETPLICASKAGHFLCSRILVSEGRASKHARDTVDFKTASEWEQTEESLSFASKSPLFMTLQLKGRDESLEEEIEVKTRPFTAPAGGMDSSKKKTSNHRDDLRRLFVYYQGQFTPAYRRGVKPKPIVIEKTQTEDSMSECSEMSEITDLVPPCLERRFSRRLSSVSKTANTAVSTGNAFRRRSIATAGLSSAPARRMSLSSSLDGRRGLSLNAPPKIRRGSINVMAKLSVQGAKPSPPKGQQLRGSLDVRNMSSKQSITSRSKSPFSDSKLMSKLQTLTETSDDDEEAEDILQRSSPAAMLTINTEA